LFRVSEGAPDVYPGEQQDSLRLGAELSVMTEHRGLCEGFEAPLDNGGLFFDLRDGASMAEAENIADFLNCNVESMGTLTFGDAEDIAIEVENSRRNLDHVEEGLTEAVNVLTTSLTSRNIELAIQNLEGVKGWAGRLVEDWRRTIERFG